MPMIHFTLTGVVLFLFADWRLDRIDPVCGRTSRGARYSPLIRSGA